MSTPFPPPRSSQSSRASRPPARSPLHAGWSRVSAAWASLATRERSMVGIAAVLVVAALLWWVGIKPALETLRGADAQHRSADAQVQGMRSLAAEAAALQAMPRVKSEESRKALELSVMQQLGASAQLTVAGERATVTLKNTPPDALGRWLSQARSNARAVPIEAHLVLNASRSGWDGTMTLALPPP